MTPDDPGNRDPTQTRDTLLDPRTLAKLHGLELRARHVVEGFVSGLHRSPYRGFSVEFAEHREYVPGDDLRHLDWKLFGRTDKFYLKRYEDETNLICYLLLDVSESMQYRSDEAPLSKLEYGQILAAALAWLVFHQNDAVGLAEQKARNEDSGLTDLFGSDLFVSETTESRYNHFDQLKCLSFRDRLNREKESLGLFLSGHLVDEYREEFRHFIDSRISEMMVTSSERCAASNPGILISFSDAPAARIGSNMLCTACATSVRL